MQTGIITTPGDGQKKSVARKVPHTTDKNLIDEIPQSSEPGRHGEGRTYVPPSLRTGSGDQEFPNDASTGSGEYGLDHFLDKDAIAGQAEGLPDVEQILAGTPLQEDTEREGLNQKRQSPSQDTMASLDTMASIQADGLASGAALRDPGTHAGASRAPGKAPVGRQSGNGQHQRSVAASLPEAEGYQEMQDDLAAGSMQHMTGESWAQDATVQAQDATVQAQDTLASLSKNVGQALDRVDQSVKKKPLAYTLGALGLGFALGRIIL